MQTSLKTLEGLKILITRPEKQNIPLSAKLRNLGATTIELPTITILPPNNTAPLDKSILDISQYDWVIFTSVHGVRFFSQRLKALGEPSDKLKQVKVAAIGPATAAALERLGKEADYVPTQFLSKKIAVGLGDVEGKRILLPRADIASKKLPELLRQRGAEVEEVVAYRTIIPEGLSVDRLKSVLNQGIDVVTFTSPSTVRNLAQIVGANELTVLLKGVKVACIGPVTAEATKELGIHVDIVARTHTIDNLVEAIKNDIRTV
ncbi:MAG: uroporphyrinogen-III synthase [Candidatus Bathyarchaeia archaeon]|jgi:uroporphyrinogen III methyltransferase/synthase